MNRYGFTTVSITWSERLRLKTRKSSRTWLRRRSELRIVREYVKGIGIGIGINYSEYEILSIFKNNFLGKIKAKRELNKWKKYHKAHNFT